MQKFFYNKMKLISWLMVLIFTISALPINVMAHIGDSYQGQLAFSDEIQLEEPEENSEEDSEENLEDSDEGNSEEDLSEEELYEEESDEELDKEDSEEDLYEDFQAPPYLTVETLEEPINLNRDENLRLRWDVADDLEHLVLNPTTNVRQRHILELNFSPLSDNIYEAGEIEIRLPQGLFEDRHGDLIISPIQFSAESSATLPPVEVPLPEAPIQGMTTAFNHYIDTDTNEIVIRNFRQVTGSDLHLRIQFAVHYLPSQSPNGFINDDIYATVAFAERHAREELESNRLSLDLTTRVVPQQSAKTTVTQTGGNTSWQSTWGGTAPENAGDLIFVRYRIFHGTSSATTQPFRAQVIETPLDNGQIVAWSGISTTAGGSNSWTRGNTAEYNEQAGRTWTIAMPGTSSVSRFQDIIVSYPRPTEQNTVVKNSVEIIFTPVDDDEAIHHEQTASHTYISPLLPNIQPNSFNISKAHV